MIYWLHLHYTFKYFICAKWHHKGVVSEASSNRPIPFANVFIEGTTIGVTTDIDGNYEITGLEPNVYDVSASYLGFKTLKKTEIQVTNSKPAIIDLQLEEEVKAFKKSVKASPFKKPVESPVSLQTIGTAEIQRNPGGNRYF